jgi:hypothetical protein
LYFFFIVLTIEKKQKKTIMNWTHKPQNYTQELSLATQQLKSQPDSVQPFETPSGSPDSSSPEKQAPPGTPSSGQSPSSATDDKNSANSTSSPNDPKRESVPLSSQETQGERGSVPLSSQETQADHLKPDDGNLN